MSRSLSTALVWICILLVAISTVESFPTCQKHFRGGFHCTGHYGQNATTKAVRRLARRQSCASRFSSSVAVSSTASSLSSSMPTVTPTSSAEPSPTLAMATAPPAQLSPDLAPAVAETSTDTPDPAPTETPAETSVPAPSATPNPEPTTSSPPPPSITTNAPNPAPTSPTGDTGSDSGSDSSNGSSNSDISQYLADHNNFRAQYDAAPLTWSDDLAAAAQQWADKCVFQHSGGTLGPYGENLAAGTGSSYGIDAAIKSWTDESSQYDPSNPQASHFTQVVWKATTQLGCAVAECSGIFPASYGEAQYYVCEYFPQGNVIGNFTANVQ